jgi:hypothetical protein
MFSAQNKEIAFRNWKGWSKDEVTAFIFWSSELRHRVGLVGKDPTDLLFQP